MTNTKKERLPTSYQNTSYQHNTDPPTTNQTLSELSATQLGPMAHSKRTPRTEDEDNYNS